MADGEGAVGRGEGGRSDAGRFVGVCELTEDAAAAICGRIAAGESLMAVGRDPAMPHRTTIRRWANRHPDFRARLVEAMREARLERRRLDRELVAQRSARPKPPRGGSASHYTPAMGEAICSRLANGESLVAIVRDAGMPSYGTVFGWLKRHADFAEDYVSARQVQADYFCDEAREVALASTHATVWSDRLRFDVIRWQAARQAPQKYCERVLVDAQIAARRAEDDPRRGDMTVIVKRFCDVTPEDEAEADATEALFR